MNQDLSLMQTLSPSSFSKRFASFRLTKAVASTARYSVFLLLPYLASFFLPMDNKGTYIAVITAINLIAMMAFYLQFPLAGRIKQIKPFSNIDWSMTTHKKVGQWIGLVFVLHPLLILAPKVMVSNSDAWNSLVTAVTAPQMLTGVIAWVMMLVWVAMSIFKNRLPIRYEIWRLQHMLGFVAISILVTLHVTTVGRHGQFQGEFNTIWWILCSLSVVGAIYNYCVKPIKLKKTPFELVSIDKISSCDWKMTVTHSSEHEFGFEAGQFVWLNTHESAHDIDYHPFSIASCSKELPNLSFIIRELGDYTSNLHTLKVGQPVYIDGPYGSLSLDDSRKAKGITLVAGGAGIGPMLSLLKQLATDKDPRPVRLIYGNNQLEQMVLQTEILSFQESMPNFKQFLVCNSPVKGQEAYQGVIDRHCLEQNLSIDDAKDWAFYICGPEKMIESVTSNLSELLVAKDNIHYEQLAF